MTSTTTKPDSSQLKKVKLPIFLTDLFDPIETQVRGRARQLIQELICCELDEALAKPAGEQH